jgi:hypothetical protein
MSTPVNSTKINPRLFVGHPPDTTPSIQRSAPRPRFAVHRSGRKRPLDGFDVIDQSHPVPILRGWCPTRTAADELAVTRHCSLHDGAEYQVCDELSGQPLYFGPSAVGAMTRASQAEQDARSACSAPVPPEAHAAIDATITLAAFEAAVEDVFPHPDDDDQVDPLPLHAALRLEADMLAVTGTIGPTSRRLFAALIREHADAAQVAQARTVEELLDRAEVLSR